MKRVIFIFGLITVLCGLAWGVEDIAVIYNGQATLPAQVTIGGWGMMSRTAANTNQTVALAPGVNGLRISSLGRYQGARFEFQPAMDLSDLFETRGGYLEVYLRNPQSPIAALSNTKKPVLMPTLKNLRFTIYTTRGQRSLAVAAAQFSPKTEVDGRWVKLDIPLAFPDKSAPIGGKMERLVLTSDDTADFLIGRLAFMRDTDPFVLKASLFPSPTVTTGRRVFFLASVDAGLAQYTVAWNFDANAGDAIDVVGERTTHIFTQEGTYHIACTVRDLNRGKDPTISYLDVTVVNPKR